MSLGCEVFCTLKERLGMCPVRHTITFDKGQKLSVINCSGPSYPRLTMLLSEEIKLAGSISEITGWQVRTVIS